MNFRSAIFSDSDPNNLARGIADQLSVIASPDLVVVFISSRLNPVFDRIVADIRRQTGARNIIACNAQSVLGNHRELENHLAVAALAMSLPGVKVNTFHLGDDQWHKLLTNPSALRSAIHGDASVRSFFLFGDPFTTPITQILEVMSREFPQAPVMGGMTSGIRAAGESRMAVDDRVFHAGAIGVALSGPVQIDCVVSQGCRPIGEAMTVTQGRGNVIAGLDNTAPMEIITDLCQSLARHDQAAVEKRGLLIGRVIDRRKGNFGRGDFLVRNILDADRTNGSITIGDLVETGQIVQFHVQDAQTATEDLHLLLQGHLVLADKPLGALMFSCNGRGAGLFGEPNHDVAAVQSLMGPLPLAGFFAAGELGPVGKSNFIHGQTVCLAMFH